jgi:release factor glutamine methyltransferase
MTVVKSSWKILDILKIATDELKKKEIESPRLNAELLLCDALNYSRIDLYLDFEKPLSESELSTFKKKLQRRLKYEPLQYIRGFTEFYGLKFEVDKNVLIPRPETELITELVITEIKKDITKKVLEIGTGSGCIAIALAQKTGAEITAIDFNGSAINTARRNAEINKIKEINFSVKDLFNDFNSFELYDIIVSNPPYVGMDEYDKLQKEITMYEPEYAITDKKDGFSYYKKIAELAGNTSRKINVFLEIGYEMKEKMEKLLKESEMKNISFHKDIHGIDRVVQFNN